MQNLRLGIIGVGSVVREIYQHLYYHSEYSPLIDVVAIADPNEEYLRWFGDTCGIPANRRFPTHQELLDAVECDAVMVNTPDTMHAGPAIAALDRGIDVLLPKPTAATVGDVHAMAEAAQRTGRLVTVDFHKRSDPRTKEAVSRYQRGDYGPLQSTVWYMIDKLMVADPNHVPRFFSSPDFAEKNTPVSFLTVHTADTLLSIIRERPLTVRAVGYRQKLAALSPISSRGYDLVDTEVLFESGAVAHFISGWHLPNSLYSYSAQWSRLVCRDAMVDLVMDHCGYMEIAEDGIFERNPLFLNHEVDGTVSGFGVSNPGRLLREIQRHRAGELSTEAAARFLDPFVIGFYTTAIVDGTHQSLAQGSEMPNGVVRGVEIDLPELVAGEIGANAAKEYYA